MDSSALPNRAPVLNLGLAEETASGQNEAAEDADGRPRAGILRRIRNMATDAVKTETKTEVGSYFVANYPPFSLWTAEAVGDVVAAFDAPPRDVPLGLY